MDPSWDMQRPAHVFWILYRPSWATNPPSCPGAKSIRCSGPKASSKASRCSNWKSLSAEKLPLLRLARKTEHRGRCSSRRDSNSSESWYSPVPIGSMYVIYGNIYHQYTPFMLAYIIIYHTWILWGTFLLAKLEYQWIHKISPFQCFFRVIP